MMPNVEFLVIAITNHYHNSDDFKSIFQFLETLYIRKITTSLERNCFNRLLKTIFNQ